MPADGDQRQLQPGKPSHRTGERTGCQDDSRGMDGFGRRTDPDRTVSGELEARNRPTQAKLRSAGLSQAQGEPAGVEPPILLPKPGRPGLGCEIGEPLPGLVAGQLLNVGQTPLTLGSDQRRLLRLTLLGRRNKEVPLVSQLQVPVIEPGLLCKPVEEVHALADQSNLFGVVELQPEGPGRNRRGQGCQGGPLLYDDRAQAGSPGEEGGSAADDAATDDDEIGGRFGRLADLDDEHAGGATRGQH